MSRGLDAQIVTALNGNTVRQIAMVELDLSPTPLYLHTGAGNIDFGGNTYLGVGSVGSISAIKEDGQISPKGVKMVLSGIDTAFVADVLGQHYKGRACNIYAALKNDDGDVIDAPFLIFPGRIDTMNLQVGEQASVQVSAESRLEDWNKSAVSRYTNEDQQALFAGDKGLEFVPQMVEKEFNWGVPHNGGSSISGGGGGGQQAIISPIRTTTLPP